MNSECSDGFAPKISIVVAAYNVEKYLPKALDSCVDQTYKNIEIVTVDDCSADGTGEILERYARQDELSRFLVIHHEKNKGTLSTRVTGIKAATGDYIMFLDGDDYLEPDACEVLVAELHKKRADILHFGANLVETEGVSEEFLRNMAAFCKADEARIEGEQGCLVRACFSERRFSWIVWNKLWRAEICKKGVSYIGNHRILLGEDTLCCFVCLLFARNSDYVDRALYNYRQGSGITALSTRKKSQIPKYAEYYFAFSEVERIYGELGLEKAFEKEIDFVRELICKDTAWYFENEVAKEEALISFERLLTCWPVDMLISALAMTAYRFGCMAPEELLTRICRADCFRVRTEKVKTVGVFTPRDDEQSKNMLVSLLQSGGYEIVFFSEERDDKADSAIAEGISQAVLPKLDPSNLKSCLNRIRAWKEVIEKYHVDMVIHDGQGDGLTFEKMAIRSSGVSFAIYSERLLSEEQQHQAERYNKLKRWSEELDAGKQWLEGHSAEQEKQIANLEAANKELHNGNELLTAGKQWLEEHSMRQEEEIKRITSVSEERAKDCDVLYKRATLTQFNHELLLKQYDELNKSYEKLKDWVAELEEGKNWLEQQYAVKETEIERLNAQLHSNGSN